MSELVQKKDQKHIDDFYRGEVERRIRDIEHALLTIDANGHFDDNIKCILNSCMQIMDLGMIHGYEGVEAIAEQMFAAARYCAWQGSSFLEDMRQKLGDALGALKQVVQIADHFEQRDLIDKARFSMDFSIDEFTTKDEKDASEDIWQEPLRGRRNLTIAESDLYEIREFTAIPKKKNTAEHAPPIEAPAIDESALAEHFDWTSGETHELEEQDNLDLTDAFEEGEICLDESTLNEQTSSEILQYLDQIEQAAKNLQEEVEPGVAIAEIAEAAQNLESLCAKVNAQKLKDMCAPIAEIAAGRLDEPELRQPAINVIIDCMLNLREFLKKGKVATAVLIELKDKIRDLDRIPHLLAAGDGDDGEDDLADMDLGGLDLPAPPKPPFVVRLKKAFGMY